MYRIMFQHNNSILVLTCRKFSDSKSYTINKKVSNKAFVKDWSRVNDARFQRYLKREGDITSEEDMVILRMLARILTMNSYQTFLLLFTATTTTSISGNDKVLFAYLFLPNLFLLCITCLFVFVLN